MHYIFEKKSLVRKINKIPKHVLKHYELWKRIVEMDGIHGLRKIKGFHDEALKGKMFGYRSSRLSKQWRVIYKLEKGSIEVYIMDINPHKYD
jgi:plasmid maintenance system killer protein